MPALSRHPHTAPHPASGDTPDLFGAPEPALPEGFRYQPDALSAAEELRLVQQFEKLPFKSYEFRGFAANRRIHTFAAHYAFAGQEEREAAVIPAYLQPLTELASHISGRPAKSFAQIMVTEYAPGAGIGWHRDRPQYEDIVGLSFLAPCAMRFRRRVGESWERLSAPVAPRSIYLLHGAARAVWQHSITPMDALRYSVTLRTFHPGKGPKS